MKRLPYEVLHQATSVLPKIYAHTDLETFPRFTADVVLRFVPADLVEYNVVGSKECVLTQQPSSPEGSRHFSTFKDHLSMHPLLRLHPPQTANTPSPVPARGDAPRRRVTRVDHEFYRLLGITDQLAFGFPGNVPDWISIILNRWKRSFCERDALVLKFLKPHLAQAHCNAAALAEFRRQSDSLSGAFASMHRGLVVLDGKERAAWMTRRAQEWLTDYFAESLSQGELPGRLQGWIRSRREWQKHNLHAGLPQPLEVARAGSRLVVRYSEDIRGRQFLFLKEEKTGVCPEEFVRLGLTQREGEVLYWICQGKSNPEIATVQGISHRTVHKHVEHILAKLGVETRVAAVLRALQALDQSETGREAVLEG